LVWYVRVRDGNKSGRIRIRAEFGTPEFEAEYSAAVTGNTQRVRDHGPETGSIAWLWERYRETGSWLKLSNATRRQRENIMKHALAPSGAEAYARIKQTDIVAGRERRAQTPAQARNFLDAMRGLFGWATKAGHIKTDPTVGVENPPRKKGAGFPAWTEADAAAYEHRWPVGTKERVWFDVLCFTGARRGDAVVIGRQHIRGGAELTFRTEKGGEEVEVTLPILPVLARTITAGPCGDLTFICGAKGRPFTKESFGNAFSEAARSAGVKKSAHGVRKIAATRAADNGATVHQLMAIFGWKTPAMALLYTQEASRRRLAREAGHLLVNDRGTSIPAPKRKVRERIQKT